VPKLNEQAYGEDDAEVINLERIETLISTVHAHPAEFIILPISYSGQNEKND